MIATAGGLRPASDGELSDSAFPLATSAEVSEPAVSPPLAAPVRADPWERQNRRFFRMNEGLDARFIRPSALGYAHRTPGPVQGGLRNVLTNLSEPVVLANDVLQFRLGHAAVTVFRFAANSTVGLLGLFDVAARAGAAHHSNGFGTTLGRYHVPPGPYVYLPLLGPSTVRDMVGSGVDGLMDPFTWARYGGRVAIATSKTVVDGLDTRARADGDLNALMESATDPYATLRSVYLQNRQHEIEGDLGDAQRALPDFDDGAPPPAPGAKPAQPQPPQTGPKSTDPSTDEPAPPAPQPPAADTPRDSTTTPPIALALAASTDFSRDTDRRTNIQEDRSGAPTH